MVKDMLKVIQRAVLPSAKVCVKWKEKGAFIEHLLRPPGSPVPGILQARTLEWVAISFSNA